MVTEKRKMSNEGRRERTRECLLDAAAVVFVRSGYHGSTVSDIVARAGVGQGSFYRHFLSKREVFDALFDRVMGQIVVEVESIAEDLPTNLDQYREVSIRVVAGAAKILRANQPLIRLFIGEGPSVDAEFRAKLEEVYQIIAGLARGYLEHAMALGFARRCNTYVVSQMLIGMGIRLMNEYFAGHLDDIGVDGAVREGVDFAFEGFGPTH